MYEFRMIDIFSSNITLMIYSTLISFQCAGSGHVGCEGSFLAYIRI